MRRRMMARWSFGAAWLLLCACAGARPDGHGSESSKTSESSPSQGVKPPQMISGGSDSSPDRAAQAGQNAAPNQTPSAPSGGSTPAGGGTAGSVSPPTGGTAGSASPPMEPNKVPPPQPQPQPGAERCPGIASSALPPSTLHAEVKDSLARWQALSAKAGGRYSYTRVFQSFSSYYCSTTIHFDAGKATSRSELSGTDSAREGVKDMLWIENAGELGTHPSACHPLVTLDALYEQCLNDVLCRDPKQNRVHLEFDAAGVLLQCLFVPIDCADDCSQGVDLKAVRIGDDAPECCPPESAPKCCMAYGGAEVDGKCSAQCDGMPLPSEPWRRQRDEYGCAKWIEPPPSSKCCGCP